MLSEKENVPATPLHDNFPSFNSFITNYLLFYLLLGCSLFHFNSICVRKPLHTENHETDSRAHRNYSRSCFAERNEKVYFQGCRKNKKLFSIKSNWSKGFIEASLSGCWRHQVDGYLLAGNMATALKKTSTRSNTEVYARGADNIQRLRSGDQR